MKIQRYELVELLIPAGAGNRVQFTDIPQLRTQNDQDIFVNQIEFFPLATYANSQTNQAIPGTPNAEIPKAVLCLYVQGEERIHYIPLAKLNTINSAAPFNVIETEFDSLARVDWTKSYIQFNAAVAGNPYIIPLGVNYVKISKS
jgi:hypothetical protein